MLAKKWRRFLTDTDIIPTDKPMFPLRILFILAICSSIIFYRFVYIYIYNSPLSKYLYDYRISYTSKTYIEGFFISTWVVFITIFLFRLSDTIFEKIILPIYKILNIIFFHILYTLNIITKKTLNTFKKKNKFFTNVSKNSKIKKAKKVKVIKNDRRKYNSTSLSRAQGTFKKKTSWMFE